MKSVLVTGATGFVGRMLCRSVTAAGGKVRGVARHVGEPERMRGIGEFIPCDLRGDFDAERLLDGIDVVVHLAARVHVMREDCPDPLAEFRSVNRRATVQLAESAARLGVRRFVYASTIKVNGESTNARPFAETDVASPQDAYAISKWEAEQELGRIATETGLEVVIVRPPLVYGPGVGGNFLRLMKLADAGLPLPLDRIDNRRSLVSVWNLCDFLMCCMSHPSAGGETFLISDGEDFSTSQLYRQIAKGLGRPSRLLPLPSSLIKFAQRSRRLRPIIERLTGSLQVDSSKAAVLLGWSPPVSAEEGVILTTQAYRDVAGWRTNGD
ncbi:MAG TPA: SDR family oxidoreductase [Burkholderiales bacterium]|nr:SDR family oxidoreductase [Burkholderiales bacterium]